MVNINDLLKMDGIAKKIAEQRKLMDQYLKGFTSALYPGKKGVLLNVDMYTIDKFNSFLETNDATRLDPKDIEEYKNCAMQYAELNQELESFKGAEYISFYNFNGYKRQFLEQLISEQHISKVEEDPQTFFKKLIELYGEKELALFNYTIESPYYGYGENDLDEDDYDDNYYDSNLGYEDDFDDDYDIEDKVHVDVYRLHDFIWGKEDEIIGDVSSVELRKTILASKLMTLMDNGPYIEGYIQQYADEAVINGKQADSILCLDEYGFVDFESTLINFDRLPISDDGNFYLCLATHLEEMGLSFEDFNKYISPDYFGDRFSSELAKASNTRRFTYQNDFIERKPSISVDDIKKVVTGQKEANKEANPLNSDAQEPGELQ